VHLLVNLLVNFYVQFSTVRNRTILSAHLVKPHGSPFRRSFTSKAWSISYPKET
jgi:hypothetical protein